MPEQLLIQPSLDQQNLCIGDLLSDINEYAGYDGCTPLDNVDREFFATVASCKDKELLNLGLNRIIVLIQRCQSGCKAIEIARRKNSLTHNI